MLDKRIAYYTKRLLPLEPSTQVNVVIHIDTKG